MDAEFHMWPYWRDKKGTTEALLGYYPELVRTDRVIQRHLAAYIDAIKLLDLRMKELEEIANTEDEE